MNQMSRWYARMLLPADVRRNDQTLHRWNRIPRLFCLMLTRLLSLASQLLETLVRLLDTSGFLTCSSSAAQCEVQGTALLPQERPPSQPANRAMRNWHVRKHPRLPFSLIAFFTSLCHPRLERGSRGSTHQSSPLRHPRPTCSSNAAQGQAQPSSPSSQEFLVSHLESRATQFAVSFFTFFTLFTFFTSAQAETIVSGEVSGVWNTDGSPYIVIDTLFVPEGDTLQIRPGVSVFFHNQTDSTRTPFCVLGSLFIDGEEGDSVCFWSEGAAFQGFYTPDEITTVNIRAHYAVFDSLQQLVDIHDAYSLVFRHCRIKTIDNLYQSYNSADTLEYCTIQYPDTAGFPGMTLRGGGPHSICHNKGYFRVQILNAEVDTLSDNDIQGFILVGAIPELFARNTIDRLMLYSGGTVSLDSNHIRVTTTIDLATVTMTHNKLNMVNLTACSVEAVNNLFYGDWDIDGGEIFLQNNLCNTNFAIDLYDESTVALINNTFHFRSTCLRLPDGSEVRNNIFMGDGIDCDALHMDAEYDNIQYNIFYNVTGMLDNGETLDETNGEANPFFEGGDPYDYHLQANSPCIDAGDPDSEDDPDGTRADIGCYYYDHSIDNPPVQTIPEEIFAQTGLLLRIQITATDDNGPFDFTFPDLPDWLTEEDELDWVSDTTVVSGTVPADAEDFSFTVIVEDGEGQTDTSLVTVDVDQRNLLRGEISGILHDEDSPFYVVEDIVVPEGDSLIIEPGCELQFRYVEDDEQRIEFCCYGSLFCEGVEGDSVFLKGSIQDLESAQWNGIELATTSYARIAYTKIENAEIALNIKDNCSANISNVIFYGNKHSVFVINNTTIAINSCYFIATNISTMQIRLRNSNITIDNTIFYCYNHVISVSVNNESILYMSNCELYNNGYIAIDMSSYSEIRRCYFYQTRLGVTFANHATGIVSNCVFNDLGTETFGAGVSVPRKAIHVENNVFLNSYSGVRFLAVSSGDTLPVVVNNLFLGNHYAIQAVDGSEDLPSIEYNNFYENDTLVYQCTIGENNLFLDPCIVDMDSFYLYDNSPLIDAGYPGLLHNDTDSTRNDIGLWGGPYGISYQYPDWVTESYDELPTEFRLSPPYPNPFNSVQNIQIALPCRCSLTLRLYNVLGRQVFTRHTPALDAGNHIVSYSANQLASGMYFLEVTAGDEVRRNRVILLK